VLKIDKTINGLDLQIIYSIPKSKSYHRCLRHQLLYTLLSYANACPPAEDRLFLSALIASQATAG
jgi:hypothetical protein